jgi:hypothetical protein
VDVDVVDAVDNEESNDGVAIENCEDVGDVEDVELIAERDTATWLLTMNRPCPALQHIALFAPQQ